MRHVFSIINVKSSVNGCLKAVLHAQGKIWGEGRCFPAFQPKPTLIRECGKNFHISLVQYLCPPQFEILATHPYVRAAVIAAIKMSRDIITISDYLVMMDFGLIHQNKLEEPEQQNVVSVSLFSFFWELSFILRQM